MTRLSVNLNKVALVRNARGGAQPSVPEAACVCVDAGAHGITVHPRPDQRHIRPGDVDDLKSMLAVEFNIEGNPFAGPEGTYPGFLEILRRARPTQATLVPDAPAQLTSDHGWTLSRDAARVAPVVRELTDLGIRVSLFMDPVPDEIRRAADLGADRIELYTEGYAAAFARGEDEARQELDRYARAAEAAHEAGLGVNAGHDLNQENLGPFCRAVPRVLEVSIGQAIVSEALLGPGLADTVRAYLAVLAACDREVGA